MRRFSLYFLAVFGLLGLLSTPVSAKPQQWEGEIQLDLGTFTRGAAEFEGTGISTLNGAGEDGNVLHTLALSGGITGSVIIPVTDPDTSGTVPSVRVTATLGTGSLYDFYPTPPWPLPWPDAQQVLPIHGLARICMFTTSCDLGLALPLTKNGTKGIGIGGLLTAGGFGGMRVSVQAAPWTVGPITDTHYTASGGTYTDTHAGTVQGPGQGAAVSAAQEGGVVQLISPVRITSTESAYPYQGVNRLTIRFVPEPPGGLMIGAGVLGLALMGRSRRKRS